MAKVVKKDVRKTITVRVSPEVHRQLKAATKFKVLTIQSVVQGMVEGWVAENFSDDMLVENEEEAS